MKTNATADNIKGLEEQLNQLQRNITDNGIYANRVVNESTNILDEAVKTYNKFNNLQVKYNDVKSDLIINLNQVQASKERANMLFNKAFNLVAKVTRTEEDILKLENEGQEDDIYDLEAQLQDLIRRMDGYTMKIEERVQYYKLCN